jgi:Type IV secretion system pilin
MNTLKQKKSLFIAVLLAALLFSMSAPFLASARGLVPCGGYKDAAGVTREAPCKFTDIFVLIAEVTDWLIGMAGIYAVFKIIDGGFWLVISMGNEETITQRKEEVTDAVLGFVLVMLAFMLVNTVVNFMITRSFVTTTNPQCRLDLTQPLNYLSPTNVLNQCSNLPDNTLHTN